MLKIIRSTIRLASTAGLLFSLLAVGNPANAQLAPPGLSAKDAAAQAVRQGLAGSAYGQVTTLQRDIGAAGLRKVGTRESLTGSEMFLLGSTTKAMTAMVTSRFIERGVLRWDTKIGEAIPALRQTMRPEYRNVTLEHLLAHRGGVATLNDESAFLGFMAYLAARPTANTQTLLDRRRLYAEWMLTQAPTEGVTPGKDFQYSNGGYVLIGAMLEAVTGKPYETLFDQELSQPLGVPGTWIRPERVSASQPVGHEGMKDRLTVLKPPVPELQEWLDVTTPAGFFSTTPDAYATWLRWHLAALQGQSTPLPAGYVQRIKQLGVGDYSVGWFGGTMGGRRTIAHGGSWYGFLSDVVVDQAGRRATFGMTNTGSFGTELDGWAVDVLRDTLVDLDARGRTR